MTSGHGHERTPDEQRALAALEQLPTPRASASARARTREAFLALADRERPAEESGRRPAHEPARHRARPWVLAAAAAVVALAAFGIWQYASGPTALWRVTDVVAAEGVTGAPAEGFVLEPGRIATGPDTELELQLGDQLKIRLRPGTAMQLPAPPRRWRPGEMALVLTEGEVYGIAEGLDAPLRVIARNSETIVHGTTWAVFQTPDASCTCLWEGSVTIVNRADGEVYDLQAGRRFLVYDDGSVSGPQPLDAGETMKLQMMHDAGLEPDPIDER